jgi:hypothetical protein
VPPDSPFCLLKRKLFTHFKFFNNMKKTIKRFGFRSLLSAVFLFGALLFGVASAQAQTSLDQAMGQAQNWKTEADAVIALEAAMEQLSADLGVLIPGSPQFRSTEGQITLYKETYVLLLANSTVQQALAGGVERINDSKNTTTSMYSSTEVVGFYNNAVVLLTN